MKIRIVLAMITATTIAITDPLERPAPIASPPRTVAAEVLGEEVALDVPDIIDVLRVDDASF